MAAKAFMDKTCRKCRKRFGWFGDVESEPPCPKCGFQDKPSEQDLKAFKEMEDILRQRMLKDE